MTNEEAALILDPETSRDALWRYEEAERLETCNEACRMGATALRAQRESNDWVCTLKCKALMDGGICGHGGLCCLYESQRIIERNEPLTLEELRQMDGEPVWIVEYPDWGHWELSEDAEDYLMDRNPDFYGMKYDDPTGRYGLHKLGWLAYRHKPESTP